MAEKEQQDEHGQDSGDALQKDSTEQQDKDKAEHKADQKEADKTFGDTLSLPKDKK